MRSSNRTGKRTKASGISKPKPKLPQVLPYPQLLPFESTLSVRELFCSIIKHYGNDGISILIYRQVQQDQVITICGDWKGNNIDLVTGDRLAKIALQFVQQELVTFLEAMRLIRVEQAQFFFAIDLDDELTLVDIQLAYNKLASPGMLNNLFGKICRTQEIIKNEIIDARAVEAIKKGRGSYEDDLILKPTRFRMHHEPDGNSFQPMYIEVKR